MRDKLLSNLTVVDLTHRLPGPLAGHLLSQMGAKTIKIEDNKFGDPFLDGFFKKMDPSFSLWYQALNEGKEIQRFSLKEETTRLIETLKGADIILMGLPEKLQFQLGVDFESLKKISTKTFSLIEMTSSHSIKKGMHDLNALAKSRLLDLYLYNQSKSHEDQKRVRPPFLPMAGIGYGAILAQQALAAFILAKELGVSQTSTVSLEESVDSLLTPFFNEELSTTGQREFLHNGRYPCYNLYPLKDVGHLAVACLEEKYWLRFCELLGLGLEEQDRFEFDDPKVFKIIEKTISALTYDDAQKIFRGQDCCVDVLGS
ncbi:MAG: CoA transferase [Bacteriovoracaceae bacterium]|nr:CoA transferase [Bacteriovoracaceae bacterium]